MSAGYALKWIDVMQERMIKSYGIWLSEPPGCSDAYCTMILQSRMLLFMCSCGHEWRCRRGRCGMCKGRDHTLGRGFLHRYGSWFWKFYHFYGLMLEWLSEEFMRLHVCGNILDMKWQTNYMSCAGFGLMIGDVAVLASSSKSLSTECSYISYELCKYSIHW